MADIQQEFQNTCAQAGHLQYQVDVYQKDLKRINSKLQDLNVEAATRSALDKQKAQEASAPPTATVDLPAPPTTEAASSAPAETQAAASV